MRRIMMLVAVAALMAAMMVASALPVLAAPPADKPGQYTCRLLGAFPPEIQTNVPQGKTAHYEGAGYQCIRNN